MIGVLEAHNRSKNGPLMDGDDFVRKFQVNLREVADKYGKDVKLDPVEELIPPPQVGDLVFEAAVELLSRVGLYNKETHRVIEFSRDEIMHTAKTRKSGFPLGEGKDEVFIRKRDIGDPEPPLRFMGPTACPIDEEYFVPMHLSYAKVPEIQGLVPGTLMNARGFRNEPNNVGELVMAIREAEMLREATRLAGRPGMPFGETPMSAVSSFGYMAAWHPNGYTNKLGMLPLQVDSVWKIGNRHIILSAFMEHHGIVQWTGCFVTLWGVTRSPWECAIACHGGELGLLTINGGNFVYSASMPATTEFRAVDVEQSEVLKNLARNRNVGVPVCAAIGTAIPGGQKTTFLQLACSSARGTLSGAGMIGGATVGMGIERNGPCGLDGQIAAEVAIATAGIHREEANKLMKRLYAITPEYIDLKNVPKGMPFPESYDVEKVEPTDKLKRVYAEAKKELKEAGILFKY